MTEKPETFTRLTWGDLEEWAGAKTLFRGRRYQEEGRVQDLARLPGALTGAYPECSTAIWRKKAERLIAETDLKSYE